MFDVFDPPTEAAPDPFSLFDEPAATEAAPDPFSLFDEPAPPPGTSSAVGIASKRPRPVTSVLPLVRRFVHDHSDRTCADLRSEAAAAAIERALGGAARCLNEEPPDLTGCRAEAERVDTLAWQALQAGGWPHVCWREAYVLAQLMLCCVDADADAEDDAVRTGILEMAPPPATPVPCVRSPSTLL